MPRSGLVTAPASPSTVLASMRPGQSCPGVARAAYSSHDSSSQRFNEAGAIMPRSGYQRQMERLGYGWRLQ